MGYQLIICMGLCLCDISLLGNNDFFVREMAERRIKGMGFLGVPASVWGSYHQDIEVRFRSNRLLLPYRVACDDIYYRAWAAYLFWGPPLDDNMADWLNKRPVIFHLKLIGLARHWKLFLKDETHPLENGHYTNSETHKEFIGKMRERAYTYSN